MVELTLGKRKQETSLRWKKKQRSFRAAAALRCTVVTSSTWLLLVDLPGHDHDRGLWSLSVAYVYPGYPSWKRLKSKNFMSLYKDSKWQRCRKKSSFSHIISISFGSSSLSTDYVLNSSGTGAQPRITYLWASQGRRRQFRVWVMLLAPLAMQNL